HNLRQQDFRIIAQAQGLATGIRIAVNVTEKRVFAPDAANVQDANGQVHFLCLFHEAPRRVRGQTASEDEDPAGGIDGLLSGG
ncbi:hypothetical protein GY663_31470, partial [Klebsiella michiganensis]|nr:hypothetical protein [Klebsiella michiganensis]